MIASSLTFEYGPLGALCLKGIKFVGIHSEMSSKFQQRNIKAVRGEGYTLD